MRRLRPLLRRVAYQSGALGVARYQLSHVLTVAMFHRVIDPSDPDFAGADSTYTVSTRLFDELLEFFRDHYEVVSLSQVMDASDRRRPLPDHSLLITFDDGWADNLRYAAPLLKSRGMPAVIFVAAEPVFSSVGTWWQEQVFSAARRGALASALGRTGLGDTIATSGGRPIDPLELVCQLGSLAEGQRAKILAFLPALAPASRMMLMPGDLRILTELGIAVGIHGCSHLPLTRVADLDAELRRARVRIASASGDAASAVALACPHGRYDARVLKVAREAGIRLVFTSDPILNRTEGGIIAPERPLGRIPIGAIHLSNRAGRLDPSAAATWLWRRPAPCH